MTWLIIQSSSTAGKKRLILSKQKSLWLLSTMVSVVPSVIINLVILIFSKEKKWLNNWFSLISISLISLLLLSYLVTFNLFFLKSVLVIITSLVIINFNGFKSFTRSHRIILRFIIFGSILLEGVFDAFNGRYDGVVKGYDYVLFFYYFLVIDDEHLTLTHKISLLPLVILSGRFSFLIALLLLAIIYRKKLLWYSLFLLPFIYSLSVVKDKVNQYYVTALGLWDYLINNSSKVFDNFDGRDDYIDGYFGSPMVLISEYKYTWENLGLLPSSEYLFLDSGPSYIFSNLGLLMGVLYYYLFFKVIRTLDRRVSVMILVLVLDCKFHTTFVPWTLLFIRFSQSHEQNNLFSCR